MSISREEIETRWLGGSSVAVGIDALVDSFSVVERMLGCGWLEEALTGGVTGPVVALPLHCVGTNLRVLERAVGGERLRERVRRRERAALTELHALALCADDLTIDSEVSPSVDVEGRQREPDFRVRKAGEPWVHVEVTAPNHSESEERARTAAASLSMSHDLIPDGVCVQVRFRDEPTDSDLDDVRSELPSAAVIGKVTERRKFVIHAEEFVRSGPEFVPIGADEEHRPLFGSAQLLVRGDGPKVTSGACLAVRVPGTDARGQRVIDTEAKQLPKAGPGLICIFTQHGAYWRGLIERSFSPDLRRRISGVLLLSSGIVLSDSGVRLLTAGRLITNPHARSPLPVWLSERLEALSRTLADDA